MAKKTNKTSHVLNLISNRTGLTEEEIAPEAASKKRTVAHAGDDLKESPSPDSAANRSPQTVDDLLAEDAPTISQDQYQTKESFSESPATEEIPERRRTLPDHEPTLNWDDVSDDKSYYENASSFSPENEDFSVSSNSSEMNIPSSPKAFADAISAAQQALADTLPPEHQPASSAVYPEMNSQTPSDSAQDSHLSETSPTASGISQKTYYYQEPAAPAEPEPLQPQTPAFEGAPGKNQTQNFGQPEQSPAPRRTFADVLPLAQNPEKEQTAFRNMLSQTDSAAQYQPHPASHGQQPPVPPMEQPFYAAQQSPQTVPQAPGNPYPNQDAPQPPYYPNQQPPQAAPGYYGSFSAHPPMPQQSAQFQPTGHPSQMPLGQAMQTQVPAGQSAQGQMPYHSMATPPPVYPQTPGYPQAAFSYAAPASSTPPLPLEQQPEITPYDGPKTAQPSLINALFGKPGSKKATPVLMDEETPDPRLFQPFDVSSVILKNIEDYVDHSGDHKDAASAKPGAPENIAKPTNRERTKSVGRDPFKDPAKGYSFHAKNIMEDLVINQMFTIMQSFNMCTCNACVNDVLALSLNSLPPKYVVSKQTSLYVKLAACEKQYGADIISAITQACILVQNSPRHEANA